MKSNRKKSTAKRVKEKTYSVPEWMDKDLAETAKPLNAVQRLAMADDLEKQASQLRGFNGKSIEHVQQVTFGIRPKQKEALEYFATQRGYKTGDADVGARWFLESALTMIGEVSDRCNQFINYREAEDVENSQLFEAETAKSLANYKAEFNTDDDNDKAGEAWKKS
jgi:hypothetical protein